MKICHVITRFILGGAQENTLATLLGLAERGHDITLVTGPSPGREGKLLDFFPELKNKAPFRLIIEQNLIRPVNPYHDFISYRHLKRFFEKEKFDIIHTHSSKAGVLGRLAGRKLRGSGKSKVIHTVHGLAFDEFQPKWKNKLYIAAEKQCAKFSDAIISVCDTMTEQALAANIGENNLFHTIYSSFNVSKFKSAAGNREYFSKKLQISNDTIVLLTISRLFPMKGIEVFLKTIETAAEKGNCPVKGIILGDGPMRSEFEDIAKKNLPENSVIFSGLTNPDEIPGFISASDIIVHASLREGLARVLVQGLAGGKPVITYDIGGAKEVVINNQNGFICPADNVRQFTKHVVNLINNNEDLERLTTGAKETDLEQFSTERMLDKIEELYGDI